MPYKAFISYSHSADPRLAAALQSALQRFAKPWYKARSFEVFRDTTDLSAAPELWAEIERALSESEFLLFLASPQAVESKWVRKELTYWLEHKKPKNVLIILTSGRITWDDLGGDFDWSQTTALPDVLRRVFPSQPLYVDFSAVDQGRLSLDDNEFLDRVATIATPLHGKRTKAEIYGEHLRQHRRTMRLAWSAAIILFVLLIGVGIAATLAYWSYEVAEQRRLDSESRRLAAVADYERDKQLDLALLLATEAVNTKPTDEARSSLLRALQARPGLSRFLHLSARSIQSMSFSPKAKKLAAGYSRLHGHGGVMLWVEDDKHWIDNTQLHVPQGGVLSVAFDRDGTTLAAGFYEESDGKGGGVMIWNASGDNWSRATQLNVSEEYVSCLAFSPCADTLAVGLAGRSNGTVILWNKVNDSWDRKVSLQTPHGHVGSVAFSPDGKTLAAGYYHRNIGDDRGGVATWHLVEGRWEGSAKLPENYGLISSVVFSPDGKSLLVGYDDNGHGKVLVWNAAGRGWKLRTTLDVPEGGVSSLAFSSDGTELATGVDNRGGGGEVVFWNVASGKKASRPTLQVPEGPVQSVAFTSSGRTLATGFNRDHGRSGVILWDVAGEEWLGGALMEVPSVTVRGVAFSADGATLAAGLSQEDDKAGGVMLWNTDGEKWWGTTRLEVGEGGVESVAFSPDGKTLAAGMGSGGNVMLWTAVDDKWVSRTPLSGAEGGITGVAFSPDGKTLAAGDFGVNHGRVLLWTACGDKWVDVPPLELADTWVHSVAFSPDGQTLAAGINGGVQFWTGTGGTWVRGTRLKHPGSVYSVAFDADGKFMAVGSTGFRHRLIISNVAVWDPRSSQWLSEQPLEGHEGRASNVVFDSAAKLLAFGIPNATRGGSVVLWDPARGARLVEATLELPGTVNGLAVRPKGAVLAASYGPSDGRPGGVALLPTSVESWIRRAGKMADRNMSWEEWRQYFPDEPRYHLTFSDLPAPPGVPSVNAPSLMELVLQVLVNCIPLMAWIAWCLWGVNWDKTWPVLAQGGWIPLVLIAVGGAFVWSQVAPSDRSFPGLSLVPNFYWQLGSVAGLIAVALFCGWLQGIMGWTPAAIGLGAGRNRTEMIS
jgi:WD40 repeat protein